MSNPNKHPPSGKREVASGERVWIAGALVMEGGMDVHAYRGTTNLSLL